VTTTACPSCATPLEVNARFCGACGFRTGVPAAPPRAANARTTAVDPMRGRVVAGRYRLAARLGEGHTCVVYRADDTATGLAVAIRVALRPRDRDDLTTFLRGVAAARGIRNDHVLAIHDVGVIDDAAFVVMELCDAPTLAAVRSRDAPVSWPRAARIGMQLCRAVAGAHAAGLVGLDVSPDRMFVGTRPRVAAVLGEGPYRGVVETGEDHVRVDLGVHTVFRHADPRCVVEAHQLGRFEYFAPQAAAKRAGRCAQRRLRDRRARVRARHRHRAVRRCPAAAVRGQAPRSASLARDRSGRRRRAAPVSRAGSRGALPARRRASRCAGALAMRCRACGQEVRDQPFCSACGNRLRMPPSRLKKPRRPELPDAVGPYRIVAQLDDGATSLLYDARDGADTPVWVRACREAELRQRFEAAVDTARRAPHPGLVRVLDAGSDADVSYAVLSPADRPLASELGEVWPWRRAVGVIVQLCDALRVLHGLGSVYRVLPEHVWIDASDGVTADVIPSLCHVPRPVPDQDPGERAIGQPIIGSLAHMSPEQLMGKRLDPRSDLYSLGVVAYELVTGRVPFHEARGPAGLITAQLKQTPIAPAELVGDLPGYVNASIRCCLDKDRAKRFGDAGELAAALEGRGPIPAPRSIPPSARGKDAGQLAPDTVLGPYQVVRRLRAGPASALYEATETATRRRVALRVVQRWLARDPAFAARFQESVDARASVRHANVVAVAGGGLFEGFLCVATELLPQPRRLPALLGTAIDVVDALGIVRQLCGGYQVAHAAGHAIGLIPGEVYLVAETAMGSDPYRSAARRDAVKLHLFAHLAARPVRGFVVDVAKRRLVSMHAWYREHRDLAPPERTLYGHLDPRGDVFSLAALAYQLVTGRPPFRDAEAQLAGRWTPAAIPPAIARGLDVDPRARFADAAELAAALT
jgi:serine/threonine protein kinase